MSLVQTDYYCVDRKQTFKFVITLFYSNRKQ